MSVYKFFDADYTGTKEYDIIGTDYQRLLSTCFKYCTTFSVIVDTHQCNEQILQQLEKYRIPLTEEIRHNYAHYNSPVKDLPKSTCYDIRHYQLTPNAQEIVSQITDRLFRWVSGWGYDNPNDPAFYRLDGSTFFSSIIHEGECTLMPYPNEDVNDIIASGPWVSIPKKGEGDGFLP